MCRSTGASIVMLWRDSQEAVHKICFGYTISLPGGNRTTKVVCRGVLHHLLWRLEHIGLCRSHHQTALWGLAAGDRQLQYKFGGYVVKHTRGIYRGGPRRKWSRLVEVVVVAGVIGSGGDAYGRYYRGIGSVVERGRGGRRRYVWIWCKDTV